MADLNVALDWMRANLGMGEHPAGSNHNAITEWAGLGNVPWCAETISRALDEAWGDSNVWQLPGVGADYRWGSAYCPNLRRHFIDAGAYDREPRPGDVIIFSWGPGQPIGDHTGLVESVPGDGTVITLEGNHNDDLVRMRRTLGCIDGFGHPPYSDAPAPAPSHADPAKPGYLTIDGEFGPPQLGQAHGVYESCKRLQVVLGVDADGDWGPQTCRATQTHLGVRADSVFGPQSTAALQRSVGVSTDGQFGPATARALQTALNADKF